LIDAIWERLRFPYSLLHQANTGPSSRALDLGINTSNHSRVIIFAGDMPLTIGGSIVGAVGVSGGEQDQAPVLAAAVCK
jgi:uncharacterized protein GlcG (DUF336 family)